MENDESNLENIRVFSSEEKTDNSETTNTESKSDANNSEPGQDSESNESNTTIGAVETAQPQEEKPIPTVNDLIMKKDEQTNEVETPKQKPVKKTKEEKPETKQNYAGLWIALIVLLVCAGLYYWQNLQKKEEEIIDAESEEV